MAAAHFVVGTQTEGVSNEIGVEKGNSHLEGVGHAGSIYFHEDALLQIEFGAKIKDAFEPTGETTATNESGDIFKGVMTLEFVANIWG